MFFMKFFIYDYEERHHDFLCTYFGHHLEQSCFHCGGHLRKIDHCGDAYFRYRKSNDQYKGWFAKI